MMLSYHLGSKFMIIICDYVNFAFLYFHIEINHIPITVILISSSIIFWGFIQDRTSSKIFRAR